MYGTVAAATVYHALAGNAQWSDGSYTDDQRLAALVRASRAMDGRYGARYSGAKATTTQERAWPRVEAFDYCAQQELPPDTIPAGVVEAAYELALVELATPRALTPTVSVGRLTKSESVDGAASRSFFSPAELAAFGETPLQQMRPTITAAEDLLSCYLHPSERRWAAVVV